MIMRPRLNDELLFRSVVYVQLRRLNVELNIISSSVLTFCERQTFQTSNLSINMGKLTALPDASNV